MSDSNPFPLPKAAFDALLRKFIDDLGDQYANAGCNDMDQSVFADLSPDDKMALYAGFLKWDEQANPYDGWEPRKFEYIGDSSWLGYLRKRMGL